MRTKTQKMSINLDKLIDNVGRFIFEKKPIMPSDVKPESKVFIELKLTDEEFFSMLKKLRDKYRVEDILFVEFDINDTVTSLASKIRKKIISNEQS